MATAKLWWNGSSWKTSKTTCVSNYDGYTPSSYAYVWYKVWIAAYDNGTVKMETSLAACAGTVSGTAWISEGNKRMADKDGTTVGNGAFSKTIDLSDAPFYWSGNVSCRIYWYDGSGNYHESAGSANYASGQIRITSSPFKTITYNANGGSGAPAALTTTIGSVTLSATKPTRTGYSFLGWSTSDTATTASYSAGGTYNLTADVTLYAVWKAASYSLTITKPNTATVSVTKNGTPVTGNTVDHDDVLTITATPAAGYRILTLQVNGSDFTSGSTHTVVGPVTIVVTTVAQSSTISSYTNSVETNGAFNLAINRYSTSHYNKLRYYDQDTLLATSDVFTETTSLSIPRAWFEDYDDVTSITIKAELTTYTDPECTTETGVKDVCYFTVTADAGMKPDLADGVVTLTPVNPGGPSEIGPARLADPGYVKGYSKVQAVFDTTKISHAIGATAGTYSIIVQNVTTTDDVTTIVSDNIINNKGALLITYTVTDSRGRSTSGTQTITVNDYAFPSVGSVNIYRCDPDMYEDDSGSYMAITTGATFTSLSDNAVTVKVQYKTVGGSYSAEQIISNGIKTKIGGSFNPDTNYVVKITVEDRVLNTNFQEVSMPRRSWDFHVRHSLGGPGAAFGKVTEHDYTLQLANGWHFKMGSTDMDENKLGYLVGLNNLIGNTALPTTAQTITGAIDELDSDISDVSSDLSDLDTDVGNLTTTVAGKSNVLSTKSFSATNISLAAANTGSKSITITRSGYTPIGIVGYALSNSSSSGTQASAINLYACYLASSTTATVYYRNVHASATAKFDVEITVLYSKN